MFNTIKIKQVRKGMAVRKAAYKKALALSEKNAIATREIKIMWLISALLSFPLFTSAALYA